jgi:hypothetical protein
MRGWPLSFLFLSHVEELFSRFVIGAGLEGFGSPFDFLCSSVGLFLSVCAVL